MKKYVLSLLVLCSLLNNITVQGQYYKLPLKVRDSLSIRLLNQAPIVIEGKLIRSEPLTLLGASSQTHYLSHFQTVKVYKNTSERNTGKMVDTFYVVTQYLPMRGIKLGHSYSIGESYILLCKPSDLKFEEALPHNSPVLLLYDYESTKSVLQGVKELEKTDKWFGFHYLVFNNRNDAISYVEDGLKKE